MKQEISEIIAILEEIANDTSVPKNVKDKVAIVIKILKNEGDLKVNVNKALNELDEVADDPNLESYTRSLVWNIVSMLEKVA